ncbi:MAG: molybdopterin-dependent oxidoreductase [Chloroflexi bacterium]|nr:molybdopterin-dependent oxidoreductase [Chloroflexota bacterium]
MMGRSSGSSRPDREEKVVPTLCSSHCGGSCLLRVHVKDGVITRIETDDSNEPQLRGCMRGRAYRQRVYAPDRVLYPLKRIGERGEGKFQRISWDEALTTVASELKRVRDTYGPASIMLAAMGGDVTMLHRAHLVDRLLSMAGGYTHTSGITSFGQGMFSSIATYGTLYASNDRADLLNSRLIILWGFDPAKSVNGTNTAWYLARAREKGTRIISVDQVFSDSAATLVSASGGWIPIKPATDTAMLLAMAYVIITEGLQDQAFLDKYTFGFDKYKDYLLGKEDGIPKTPQWAESITGVSAETIANLAREYATTKPAALLSGIAPGRTTCGEMHHRAASVLAAITGNVGIPGGDAAGRAWESFLGGLPYKISPTRTGMPTAKNPVDEGFPLSKNHLPAYSGPWVPYSRVADALIKGKAGGYYADYKLLFMVNVNFLNAMPNINKVVEALKKPEFTMVMEQFMTPTVKFADIVLPVCTYMERNDFTAGAQTYFYGFQNKAIEPLGESKSHLDICTALAEKLGISDYNDKTEDYWLRHLAQKAEIPDYERFKKDCVYHIETDEPYVAFKEQIDDPEHHPFRTPSGKIEIYSQVMAEWNNPRLPPIPKWIDSIEIPGDPLSEKFPLQLITSHGKRRALGQFETLPWLKELVPQEVWLNPADARARGIKDGDMVQAFNGRGVVMLPAKVTPRIMPGVVQIESGAWYNPDGKGVDRGGNSNVLTTDEPSLAGNFSYNNCLVEVKKVEGQVD